MFEYFEDHNHISKFIQELIETLFSFCFAEAAGISKGMKTSSKEIHQRQVEEDRPLLC